MTTQLAGVLGQVTGVGRLGRLAGWARLLSEVEARFLAGTVPHSRRSFWQPQASQLGDQFRLPDHQNRDGRVLGHVGGLTAEVAADAVLGQRPNDQ